MHRVQRVPATEASGRIHTSTATVAVLPEAEEVDIQINDKDLRVDTFCSSGPGGQSVNTTYSAVRLTHIPTGVVVSQQDEKSQIKNRAKAMKVLRARLYEMELRKQQDAIAKDRRSQVGTGDRSEKIRTYNFPDSRIKDHRANFLTHRINEVLNGDLAELLDNVITHHLSEKLKDATAGGRLTGRTHPPTCPMATIQDRVAAARQTLRDAGIGPDEAELSARMLAEHVLGWDTARYFTSSNEAEPSKFAESYDALVARARGPRAVRLHHRPAGILGSVVRGVAGGPDSAAGNRADRRGRARRARQRSRPRPGDRRRGNRLRVPGRRARARVPAGVGRRHRHLRRRARRRTAERRRHGVADRIRFLHANMLDTLGGLRSDRRQPALRPPGRSPGAAARGARLRAGGRAVRRRQRLRPRRLGGRAGRRPASTGRLPDLRVRFRAGRRRRGVDREDAGTHTGRLGSAAICRGSRGRRCRRDKIAKVADPFASLLG